LINKQIINYACNVVCRDILVAPATPGEGIGENIGENRKTIFRNRILHWLFNLGCNIFYWMCEVK